MKTTRLLLLEPDASRASSLAQVFEALRMPVRVVDSIDELARVAAADESERCGRTRVRPTSRS
jgi:hypothetical protein